MPQVCSVVYVWAVIVWWVVVYTTGAQNVLMHHIVLQQRVTLDCVLLSHLQDCSLTQHRRHTEHTHFNKLVRMYAYDEATLVSCL